MIGLVTVNAGPDRRLYLTAALRISSVARLKETPYWLLVFPNCSLLFFYLSTQFDDVFQVALCPGGQSRVKH
jgi:hypothetical protein